MIVYTQQLIIFYDGSKEAYGAVAYARWELQDGALPYTLIESKCIENPLKVMSMVLIELNGAVFGKGLGGFINKESRIQFNSPRLIF